MLWFIVSSWLFLLILQNRRVRPLGLKCKSRSFDKNFEKAHAKTTVTEHADAIRGKVVITMANALIRVGKEFQPLIPPRGSIAAHVQAAIPASHVVAAFQHLPAIELGALDHDVDSDVLICSDNSEATKTVSSIVAHIAGCRPLNAGLLSNALAIEALTAVLLQLNVRYKTRVAPRFTGIN